MIRIELIDMTDIANQFYACSDKDRLEWLKKHPDPTKVSKQYNIMIEQLFATGDKQRVLNELQSEGNKFINDLIGAESFSSFRDSRSFYQILISRLKNRGVIK